MELFGFPFQTNNIIVNPMFFIFIFLCSIFWISRKFLSRTGKKKAAPKAGGAWPLIGHLHLLGGAEPPHKVLGKMAEKYGPIFTIKIGVHRALVVSNWETAKECFTTHDKVFADRPKTLASELLTYDGAMIGFSPYGSYWRQVRKITTVELLSTYRLGKLKDVRESEVRAFLKELYKLWDENRGGGASKSKSNEVLVEMKGWFGDLTLNIVLRTIVGKTVGYITSVGDEDSVKGWKKGLTDLFYLIGMFSVSDALPFLRFLDLGGHGEAMKKIAKELDLVVEDWLEEHKQKRAAGVVEGKEDFMDLMLHVFGDGAGASDTTIKATSLALILAASDTTAVTLTWALSLLVNNPDALKKAQLELDTHVGKERQVEESDVQNLVYLKAVLKETLRLYPAGPLLIPHEAIEDCTIDGYHVPRGTRLLVNLPKIHRDARVWSNPNEFDPERFLTTHRDFDVRGHNFEFFPFGSGRRMCPGISFALHIMELALASLLHGFDFATPSGEPIDMHESSGLTNLRATPLEVLLSPRLPSRLYGH
ncbi:hypothetical protein OIU85_011849 [Salix viminalis]|uniref:Cytochrome P450 n=1 Tax=Salix viminalis TaxID=40686 RepID=A0A9Q0NTL7_SALVM|nr:hypothetical protein OIU85_011849 [Salix viminalis]